MTTDTMEPLAPETQAPATELTVIERADLALDASQTEKHLRELVAKSVSITEIKDRAGRDQCHRAAMELADARIAIQKTGKAAREDATKFSKAVIAREKELVEIVTPEETRLLSVCDTWDAAVEAERAAAAAAEQARVTGIQDRIEAMRASADLAAQARTSAAVERFIHKVNGTVIDDTFAEFSEQATTVKAQTLQRLKDISDAKLADETERARIKAEQDAEAARLKSEREAFERQQAEAAAAKAQAEAKLEAEAAELQRQREAFEAEKEQLAQRERIRKLKLAENGALSAAINGSPESFAALRSAHEELIAAQAAEMERRAQAQRDADAAAELAAAKNNPDGAELSPAAQAINEQEGAARFAAAHPSISAQEAEPDAADMPVTMTEPAPIDPSDADVIWTAARAVADAYGMTLERAIQRLSDINDWIS